MTNLMTFAQLSVITGTSLPNVHKYKDRLTLIEPFPNDHQMPVHKGQDMIVCDRKLKALLTALKLGGKHADTNYDPLFRAEQEFDFIHWKNN